MCVHHTITASGILVTFDDKKEPASSGLRKTLGLRVADEEENSEQRDSTSLAPPVRATKIAPRLSSREVPNFMASGRSYKMGCGIGGRKLIRGY